MFCRCMQESKYVFRFLDLNDAENKILCKSVGKRVYGFTCLLSHKVVVELSAKRMAYTLT
jgi:hypothetical protein